MNIEQTSRYVSRLTRNTIALVLAGGRGGRLCQLTDWRVKPAVPFGGKFRIIDFPLSNCVNSDIRRIGVITQYKAHSLIRHIQKGWGFLRGEVGEFVELMPAQQRLRNASWYSGTADAVYQNLDILRNHQPEYILVLAGDHIYKMDYGVMIAAHYENNADMTVGCIETPIEMAKSFGVMTVDETGRVSKFTEKPAQPESLPNNADVAMASMGIYVFKADYLYKKLIEDADDQHSTHDFGKDLIPRLIADNDRIFAHRFRDPVTGKQPYWRDVGTVDAFWNANMELVSVDTELDIYDKNWPIWTYQEQLPPAKFIRNHEKQSLGAVDSMVSGGCIIKGATILRSLLFSNVIANDSVLIEDSVILPDVKIGANSVIKKAVIDKGCVIPEGTEIGVDLEKDQQRFQLIKDGIVLVTPDMLGQELHHSR